MKRKVRPNVVSGGTAINLGNNLYYMRGKTHKQGGIDIGSNPKTGIEVENGEVVQTSPTGLRVFSAQPILNGISPANALLMGGNPNNIFNAQEAWKQANHYNDDGTKFEGGGYTPSKEIIDYIKKTEGFRDKWYKDGNGIDTIGYGFTGDNVKKLFADGITREQADKYFLETLNRRAKILERDTPNWDKLTQSQKDSLLSYAYNIGPGNYKRSKKLQEALLNEDWDNVANNISIGYNDKRNPGLRKRRDYERELFKRDIKSSFTGDEEKAFKDWYDRYSRVQNLDPNPDAKEHYYDYRTYWKNRTPEQMNDEWKLGNHLPDTYKMPGHPTFSTESIYSTRKTPGGTWKKVGLGPVYDEQFVDSKYTKRLKTYQNVSFALGGDKETINVPNVQYRKLEKRWKKLVNGVAEKIGISEKDVENYFNSGRLNPAIGAYYSIENGGRVRRNDSPTADESEKFNDRVNKTIYGNVKKTSAIPQTGKPNMKYGIPYLIDKEIKIDGVGRMPTNALDSLAKYASITGISLQEALGLAGQETKGGANPYGNTNGTKEENRALLNGNYFREFGFIPAEYLVRDFEYNREGHSVDRNIPPLQHAFQYYKAGKYNSNDKSHSADVLNTGRIMLNDKDVRDWINSSEYTKNLRKYQNVSFELGGTHTVQKGDTLTGIAKKYNIPYSQLLSYNRDIANPNVIRIGQTINLKDNSEQSKPQTRNIREYYEQEAKLNLDNVSAIQGAKHKQNYAIIDKDAKTIKVYDINNNLLYESNQINTGKANTDYNTVTYKHKDTKKLLYGEGNNATPAGITVISSKASYHGSPSFQRARVDGNGNMLFTKEGLPDNIPSSIHWEKGIAGPNASNGCVRADSKTLRELNKYLDVGSMVYTLPQQHGSSFQLRDGRLNFVDNRTQNERNDDDIYRKGYKTLSDGRIVPLKYHRDINTVYNGTYLPIGIEDTLTEQRQNPNKIKAFLEDLYFSPGRQAVERDEAKGISRFQEIKSRNRKEYADSIVNNKEAIMKAIPGLSNKEYNQLVTMALGIPERETHYGTDIKQIATNIMSDSMLSLARRIKGQKDTVRSVGIGKIKSAADNEEMRNIYSTLGINYTDKNMSPEDSAKMVMSKLAYTYLNEIKGRTFVDANGNALTPEQALYYAYTGNKKKKIRDNFYQYEKNYPKEHYNDIINYGNEFNVTQQFKYGGIHIKPSKRGTFTAAAKRHHMGVQEFARTVLNNRARYSAAMIKKANFARNASKWHKKELGGDMTKQYYITKDNIYSLGGSSKRKAPLGTQYIVDENGRIVPINIPNTGINIANIGEINRLLDPVTVTDSAPKTPSVTGRAEIIPQINQSILAPNSHVIQRRLPVSIQDIVNPITSPRDSALNKPDFNSTMLSAFPNPDFDGTVGTIKEKSSTGVAPRNPYYSRLNVGLHKAGNYIRNNPDLIGLGVNLTGNLAASLINRSAIKGMRYVDAPIPISAQKLPTEVNIEPQVSSIKENVAGQERLIADNTADSRVALARRQRVRNQGAQQYQTLFGNKLNTELQLLTADRLNRQGVDAQNVAQYNQWRRGLYDFENRRREMLAENAVAGINNAAEAIAGERGYLARREARKQDARNRALIALTSPNAQKVFDANPGLYEELIRKMSKYGGNFNLLTKRLKK